MEPSNIDNLFKNKLEYREIEFRHSAWEAAEKMIAEQERKRDWRRFGWLFLLLPLGMLAYFFLSKPSIPLAIPMNQGNLSTNATTSDKVDNTITTLSDENITATVTATDSESVYKNSSSVKVEDNKEKEQTHIIGKPKDQINIENPTPSNTTKSGTINKTNDSSTLLPAMENKVDDTPSNKTLTKKKKTKLPQAFLNQEESLEQNTESDKTISTADQESILNNQMDLNAALESVLEKSDISKLDLPDLLFQLNEENVNPNKEELKKYKAKRFAWGAMSSVLWTPDYNDRNLGFSGANAGLTFGWAFDRRWSANADLLYEFHKGGVSFPDGNNTLLTDYNNYSFGLEERVLEVELKQSHLVTLPLYLKFHMRRHQLEAGIQASYVFGLRGAVTEETISTNSDIEKASSRENTWIEVEGVNPFKFNLLAGYRFNISDNLNIGLRVVMVPNRENSANEDAAVAGSERAEFYDPRLDPNLVLAENSYSPESTSSQKTSIPLLKDNAFNFQLSVQYFFNKKPSYTYKPLLSL